MNDLKKEEGYILVAVIGILTILSLMTITFATLSRIETRATRNYADSVKCEMVAKAGLEHALYIIRYDKFGSNDVAYDDYNSEGDTNYDYYDPSGDASWPGDGIFDGSDYDNDGNGTDDSTWIYFPLTAVAGIDTTAIRLPGNLLARYAVLITDDREARVNINVTGNEASISSTHTSNEGWSTFEIDLSFTIEQAGINPGNAKNIAGDIIDARHGDDLNPGDTDLDDDSSKIPDPAGDGIDNNGDLTTDEGGEDTDEPNEFNSIFPIGDDVPFGLLTEAEIMGTSSYVSRLEKIFDDVMPPIDQPLLKGWLTTYSADTILCPSYTLGTSTATTMLNINALVNNEGAYDDNEVYYDSDKKVEMIMDVLNVTGGLTGSSGSAGYVERHQMAVNIMDFIDSYGTVTTYLDVSTGDTYYGVERTPYINEVEADVNGATSGGNGKFIELFNPYDTLINFSGNWQLEFGTNTVSLSGTINAQDYYVIADTAQAYVTDFNYDSGAAADQYDVKVNDLATGGEYINLKDQNGNTVQYTNYGNETGASTATRQLNDPRPTPLENELGNNSISPDSPWQWANENTQTAGNTNNNFDPTKGDDGWEDTTPTHWNSFLVANRRFSNKGYIGFIHNGRQWSSFLVDSSIAYPNVLQYFTVTDPSMDGIDNDGDDDIDSDDTGLQDGDFDGPEYRIPGLINVNTAPIEVLASLPDGSGGTLGSTIAGEISSGSKPYESIGDLIDKVDGVNGITDTSAINNKWNRERRFRAISNLITTRSNVFTVYVTAQITKEDLSEKYAEKRIMAIVDRSVDPIRVRYFRWITE